jgi:hypothetical protein
MLLSGLVGYCLVFETPAFRDARALTPWILVSGGFVL